MNLLNLSSRKTLIVALRAFFLTFGFVIYLAHLNSMYVSTIKQTLLLWGRGSNRNFTSTCNWESDQRGANQKIIAYSIYGNLSNTELVQRYLGCLKVTLNKVSEAFPGWVVRIYYNVDSNDEIGLKNLQDSLPADSDFIDLCNATEIIQRRKLGNLFPMTWRWLPMLDDLVDVYLSRDTDSPLLPREEAAVREWLENNQTFHSMRDHPFHCIPMLGGLWGVKLNQSRLSITRAFENLMAHNHSQHRYYDQTLLIKHIWPIAKLDMMSHDSYCCGSFPSKPFPTPREGGKFVGMVMMKGCQPNSTFDGKVKECPQNCRPKNKLFDWRFC